MNYHQNILFKLGLIIITISCGQNENGKQDSSNQEPSDPQNPDLTKPPLEIKSFEIEIPRAKEPAVLNLVKTAYGASIYIKSYPVNFKGILSFINLNAGTEFKQGGVTKENCKRVQDKSSNEWEKQFIRKFGSMHINLDTGINFFAEFNRNAENKAANILGIYNSQIDSSNISNNFNFSKIDYIIEYNDNAISNIMDDRIEKGSISTEMINGKREAFTIDTNYQDLVCDLYLGRAKLIMTIKGNYYEIINDGKIKSYKANVIFNENLK